MNSGWREFCSCVWLQVKAPWIKHFYFSDMHTWVVPGWVLCHVSSFLRSAQVSVLLHACDMLLWSAFSLYIEHMFVWLHPCTTPLSSSVFLPGSRRWWLVGRGRKVWQTRTSARKISRRCGSECVASCPVCAWVPTRRRLLLKVQTLVCPSVSADACCRGPGDGTTWWRITWMRTNQLTLSLRARDVFYLSVLSWRSNTENLTHANLQCPCVFHRLLDCS